MTKQNENRDWLALHGLEVVCIIGDLPEERVLEQRLMLDVWLTCDLAAAGEGDALCDTVCEMDAGHMTMIGGMAHA